MIKYLAIIAILGLAAIFLINNTFQPEQEIIPEHNTSASAIESVKKQDIKEEDKKDKEEIIKEIIIEEKKIVAVPEIKTQDKPEIDLIKLGKQLQEAKEQLKDMQLRVSEVKEAEIDAEKTAINEKVKIKKSLPPGFGIGGPEPDTIAPVLTLNQSFYILINATSTTLSGTISEPATLYVNFNNATSTKEINDNWTYALNLDNGSTAISLFAKDASNNKSNLIEIVLEVDSEAPIGNLNISQQGVLSFIIEAISDASDLSSIELWQAGEKLANASSSPLTYEYTGESGITYDFSALFIDNAGNQAELINSVDIALIRINEIAWMGDTDSYNNEWLELFNNSSSTISLDAWVLSADDGTPEIDLLGELGAGEYLVLQRGSGKDYTGAMENKGEIFTLADENGWIMDYVNGEPWPAGDNSNKKTMERIDFNNWQTSTNPNGTPGSQNSSP